LTLPARLDTASGMDAGLQRQIARREAVIARVKQILIEDLHAATDPEAIDLDAALFGTGLGLDSVDGLELVVATETSFGLTLPQEAMRSSLRTVNTLVDLILRYQPAPEDEARV